MKRKGVSRFLLTALLTTIAAGHVAQAEVNQIKIAQQYGLSSLPFMIMEDQHLIEKQAKRLRLGDVKVTWMKFGSPGAINDALIAGDLDFGNVGVPSLITLWEKTRSTGVGIRGAGGVVNMPMDLVTVNPGVKQISDFTGKDKIAVTTIKVSNQALLLEMAAAQKFGEKNYNKLDPLTLSLSHPEATTALLSGSNAITAHFSALPFQYREKKDAKVHTILSSYDVLGGPATNTVAITTSRFYQANPKAYKAFVAALEEADAMINHDKKAAAATYKRMQGASESVDELYAMISDPHVQFTLTPSRTMKTAAFMHRIGRLKTAPASWKDLFFSNIYNRPGS